MGLGALLIFFGVSLLSVRFVQPIAGVRLAGGSDRRRLRRARPRQLPPQSAADGLDRFRADDRARAGHSRLVLAAGIVSTFRDAVDELWGQGDYALTAQNNFTPIPVAVGSGRRGAGSRSGHERPHRRRLRLRRPLLRDRGRSRVATLLHDRLERGIASGALLLGASGAFVDDCTPTRTTSEWGSNFELTFPSGQKQTSRSEGSSTRPPAGRRSDA